MKSAKRCKILRLVCNQSTEFSVSYAFYFIKIECMVPKLRWFKYWDIMRIFFISFVFYCFSTSDFYYVFLTIIFVIIKYTQTTFCFFTNLQITVGKEQPYYFDWMSTIFIIISLFASYMLSLPFVYLPSNDIYHKKQQQQQQQQQQGKRNHNLIEKNV